jgi:hypothetical protein
MGESPLLVSEAYHTLPLRQTIGYSEGELSDASGYHISFSQMIASAILPLAAVAP